MCASSSHMLTRHTADAASTGLLLQKYLQRQALEAGANLAQLQLEVAALQEEVDVCVSKERQDHPMEPEV